MSLRSPKNPYRVEINFDKALEFGHVNSYTGISVDAVLGLAIGDLKRYKASGKVRIWHNAATYPEFDWQLIQESYYKSDGTLDASRNIGARILAIRKEAGMTQTQLAEKCGMAQPNIARIEAGTYATSLDVLSRIADALGKRIDLV